MLFVRDVLPDVRYAARILSRAPAFTLMAVLTLALGIGATTTIFGVVNGVLLEPLPYPEANRIVLVTHEPDVAAFAYRSIHIRDGQVENDVRRAA